MASNDDDRHLPVPYGSDRGRYRLTGSEIVPAGNRLPAAPSARARSVERERPVTAPRERTPVARPEPVRRPAPRPQPTDPRPPTTMPRRPSSIPVESQWDWVAESRSEVIPAGDGVPSTYTPPDARVIREVADFAAERAPRPFAAQPPLSPFPLERPRRIGWALVLAAVAETVVAVAAIVSGNYVIGFGAVSAIAMCGMFLVAAEAMTSRGPGR